MKDKPLAKLLMDEAGATQRISKQINIGKELLETEKSTKQEFDKLKSETRKWTDYNKTLFNALFDESPLSFLHGSVSVFLSGQSLSEKISSHKEDISRWINDLESVYEQLDIYTELPNNTQHTMSNDTTNNENKKIFIGHGRSHVWRELKDFIVETLGLEYEEFNRISPAGKTNKERLKEMLEVCCMAFLIMTGEDEQADGSFSARDNVIHEAGLFQGKIDFERAIILLEEGCQEFSNIEGLGQIRFSKGKIEETFGGIIKVLKRESIT